MKHKPLKCWHEFIHGCLDFNWEKVPGLTKKSFLNLYLLLIFSYFWRQAYWYTLSHATRVVWHRCHWRLPKYLRLLLIYRQSTRVLSCPLWQLQKYWGFQWQKNINLHFMWAYVTILLWCSQIGTFFPPSKLKSFSQNCLMSMLISR